MIRGIVIGKFYPPHKGHEYLINYALARVDSLTVLVCDSLQYTISAQRRQQWLQKIHPRAHVIIIPDINDDDNSEAWAKHTLEFLGYTPDYVFSSENYGKSYAHFMKTQHTMVDQKRIHVPISATRVRNNVLQEWPYLHEVVRKDLAIRIVVLGAESTGTTALAKDLGERFKAPWVPEYGRLYSESFSHTKHTWTDDEFIHIAHTQQVLENQVAVSSGGILFCDTNASTTVAWQERYMSHTTKEVLNIADKDIVDLYIVTGDEIPFVQDGTRDGEHIRHKMHQHFLEVLQNQVIPFIVVTGSEKDRCTKATKAINELLKQGIFAQSTARL
jgi:HTH-type transcriptional repressor of NAD biosynthesis genes